jgi:hypothetical protein
LLRVVLGVVLDVLLMSFQISNDSLLLVELGIEEVGITLEFVCKSLLWLVNEFGFISNSLKECIIYLSLNIVVMVFPLVIFVVVVDLLQFGVHSILLIVKLVNNVVILLLLFSMDSLDFRHSVS